MNKKPYVVSVHVCVRAFMCACVLSCALMCGGVYVCAYHLLPMAYGFPCQQQYYVRLFMFSETQINLQKIFDV